MRNHVARPTQPLATTQRHLPPIAQNLTPLSAHNNHYLATNCTPTDASARPKGHVRYAAIRANQKYNWHHACATQHALIDNTHDEASMLISRHRLTVHQPHANQPAVLEIRSGTTMQSSHSTANPPCLPLPAPPPTRPLPHRHRPHSRLRRPLAATPTLLPLPCPASLALSNTALSASVPSSILLSPPQARS